MLSFLSPFGKKQISSASSSARRPQAPARKRSRPAMSANAFFDTVSRFDGRD